MYIVLVVCIVICNLCIGEALNSDGQSLVSFRNEIFSDPQKSMSDWDDTDATPCRWSGITCTSIRGESEPRVRSVSLPKKELVGSVSPYLGSLPYMDHLNLGHNQLIGGVPPELFNASVLRTLILSENDLSGPLPESVRRTSATLETLDLSGNGFSGGIPSTVVWCKSLQSLTLNGNRFTGVIPAGISKLANLHRLDLSSNMLTGTIPEELGELRFLQGTLNLSENNLSGPIPASLGRLPISVSIDLSFNNLSGQIPLNGSLSNQGPTAFLGNPGLCGLPLKTQCVDFPKLPVFGSHRPPVNATGLTQRQRSRAGLSTKQVVAIAVGDSVGILLIAGVLFYCFYCSKRKKKGRGFSCCISVRDGNSESENGGPEVGGLSEVFYRQNGGELLHFDEESEKMFDLDALLRASAYVLSKGSSGIVYKAVMEGGQAVVVRRLGEEAVNSKKAIKEFESEVKFIGSIRHPNVVALRAYYCGMNERLLIYDFMPNGNLAFALEEHQVLVEQEHKMDDVACLTWPKRLNIAKDVARGLAFLHEGTTARRNVHGNLKPYNVLLDANRRACIADMGIVRLCEILASHDTLSSTPSVRSEMAAGNRSSRSHVDATGAIELVENPAVGSNSSLSLYSASNSIYKPPEAVPSLRPTQKWDVYAYGVILLELLTGSASAQLASSDVDMVFAVRKMLTSASPSHKLSSMNENPAKSHGIPDTETGKSHEIPNEANKASSSNAPTSKMLMDGIRAESEAIELLQVATRCVATSPDQRPKMKHVLEALHKISPHSS